MANHKSAKKEIRASETKRVRNKHQKKTMRNALKSFRTDKSKDLVQELPKMASMLDKLAKTGVIHKNKASNLKAKLAKQAKTVKAA